ncbi:hydrogenase small subunit [Candidatus Desulforudis audaxviator]|uniref:hydrogenase small subunit n=1 Tax=Candidatus Desulforudis audaxviator TaxID=471827 RepID=UPI0002F216A0|nr:hydrogenase small subunit [Candidatus Desulforudis audaxviator]
MRVKRHPVQTGSGRDDAGHGEGGGGPPPPSGTGTAAGSRPRARSTRAPEPPAADTERLEKHPLVWLETNTCHGNILSLMNGQHPDFEAIMRELLDVYWTNTLMGAKGHQAIEVLEKVMVERPGDYILVVEGTVPTAAGGRYAHIGLRGNGEPWTAWDAVVELAAAAKHVVAVGSCAAWGLPFGAHPNPTGSKPVSAVVDRTVINVPGCPAHPDWILGTLAHLIWYGVPELDAMNRPVVFYGETIHNLCQRRHYFESGIFAGEIGEPWCLYKIGCKGPVTYADCPSRQWCGEHMNWPVGANTPCIGCTSPEFLEHTAPFFEHLPDVRLPGVRVTADRVGAATGLAAALGIGLHLTGKLLTGRLQKEWGKGLRKAGKALRRKRK